MENLNKVHSQKNVDDKYDALISVIYRTNNVVNEIMPEKKHKHSRQITKQLHQNRADKKKIAYSIN